VWQLVITKCDSLIYYKVRQLVITKCDSYFITKCDKCYYKVRQVLQSATVLLQSATGITKCDDYYKVRQNTLCSPVPRCKLTMFPRCSPKPLRDPQCHLTAWAAVALPSCSFIRIRTLSSVSSTDKPSRMWCFSRMLAFRPRFHATSGNSLGYLQSRAQSLPGSVSGWGAGKNSGITELIQFFWLAIGENNEMTEVSNNGNR